MKITIQPTVISIVLVTLLLTILLLFINKALKNFDPLDKPKGLVLLSLMAVDMVDNTVGKDVYPEVKEYLGPYVGFLWGYVFVSNIFGLTGFESPTGNYSVTLVLALITIIMVEVHSIKYNGIKSYLHGFIEPIPVFLPMNIIGKISPLISMSMRLFANMLAGSIIMSLVYAATSLLSSFVPVVGQFNFVGVVLAPALHAYFDLVSGLIQTFIFTSLTIIFIGKELPTRE